MKEFALVKGKALAGALTCLFLCQWRCRSHAVARSPLATDPSPRLRPHIGTDPDPPLHIEERRGSARSCLATYELRRPRS
nr:hypothetical protein Iba_chr05cCG11550 [Ipomoea batatas]